MAGVDEFERFVFREFRNDRSELSREFDLCFYKIEFRDRFDSRCDSRKLFA
jgi:hypothetical protein